MHFLFFSRLFLWKVKSSAFICHYLGENSNFEAKRPEIYVRSSPLQIFESLGSLKFQLISLKETFTTIKMNFAWVFLVNSLTPILFTSSVSGVDLIKKSIEDGHTIGLVSTSQGSYSINSTLDEYKEDASDFPFSWVPPTLDDIDFVQFDFRIPYSITSLTVILNPFGGTYAHQNTAFYSALSKVKYILYNCIFTYSSLLVSHLWTVIKTWKLSQDPDLKISFCWIFFRVRLVSNFKRSWCFCFLRKLKKAPWLRKL